MLHLTSYRAYRNDFIIISIEIFSVDIGSIKKSANCNKEKRSIISVPLSCGFNFRIDLSAMKVTEIWHAEAYNLIFSWQPYSIDRMQFQIQHISTYSLILNAFVLLWECSNLLYKMLRQWQRHYTILHCKKTHI